MVAMHFFGACRTKLAPIVEQKIFCPQLIPCKPAFDIIGMMFAYIRIGYVVHAGMPNAVSSDFMRPFGAAFLSLAGTDIKTE